MPPIVADSFKNFHVPTEVILFTHGPKQDSDHNKPIEPFLYRRLLLIKLSLQGMA